MENNYTPTLIYLIKFNLKLSFRNVCKYLFEKYNTESLEKTKNFDTKLVLKNLKLYLKNKIYEILDIKNPLAGYIEEMVKNNKKSLL